MAELREVLALLGFEASPPAPAGASTGDDGARQPAAFALALFAAAEQALGDPLIGLHAAAQVRPRGALVHLLLSAASLRAAIGYVERFSRILIDSLAISARIGRARTELPRLR